MSAAILDASSPLPVPDADVLAWADVGSPDVVWALAARPRLVTAADGQPEATLMLYRRGEGNPPDGGQLTLTVDLALTAREREVVATVGEARRPRPADPRAQPPPVAVRTPGWTDALVRAELASGVVAEGRPSLMGDNTCLLALQLDAAQAAEIQRAWEDGFPDATIELRGAVDGTYSAEVTGTVTASSTTTSSSTSTAPAGGPTADPADCPAPGASDGTADPAGAGSGRGGGAGGTSEHHTEQRQLRVSVAAAARGAVAVPLHLHGPLRLPAEARVARRTDLTL